MAGQEVREKCGLSGLDGPVRVGVGVRPTPWGRDNEGARRQPMQERPDTLPKACYICVDRQSARPRAPVSGMGTVLIWGEEIFVSWSGQHATSVPRAPIPAEELDSIALNVGRRVLRRACPRCPTEFGLQLDSKEEVTKDSGVVSL